ncbi:MAG: Gx transporter family protein [Candidatus Cloacimonetes bacterium]|nr:Gx transporter family protein [Candidatus Cloacimonadota bacterium]
MSSMFMTPTGKRDRIILLAFLTAFASTIYMVETFIPKPLPFLRLGLANIVVLITLLLGQLRAALLVALGKSVIGGFITGTLLSPTTLLSLGGSISSILVMFLIIHADLGMSIIGVSIGGAVVHNLVQLSIVRVLLIPQDRIFYLTPLLLIMGIVTGAFTGFITGLTVKKISVWNLNE